MAELKKTVATVKPVATIKTPVVAEEKKVEAPKAVAKKPAAKKAAAKKPAVKKAPVAAAKKAPTKKAEPKKAVAEKAPTKKAPAKKAAAKKPAAKKTVAAAPVVKTNIVLQYADKNVTYDTLVENAQNVIQYDMGKQLTDIKKLDLYVKPEENTVYFVLNDKEHNQYGL